MKFLATIWLVPLLSLAPVGSVQAQQGPPAYFVVDGSFANTFNGSEQLAVHGDSTTGGFGGRVPLDFGGYLTATASVGGGSSTVVFSGFDNPVDAWLICGFTGCSGIVPYGSIAVTVSVYVRGGPGTPFRIISTAGGSLSASITKTTACAANNVANTTAGASWNAVSASSNQNGTRGYCGVGPPSFGNAAVSENNVGTGISTGPTFAFNGDIYSYASGLTGNFGVGVFGTDDPDYTGQAQGNVTWSVSVVPDDTLPNPCHGQGSDVGCQNQSLGENIPIVGTPFFLRYQSDRAIGRAGADVVAINDARSIGGWTLNVHHAYEPALRQYCEGGQTCSPYAVVPKALFLGDGTARSDATVQAPVLVGTNIYLASEDRAEVYVFDGSSYLHLQTLGALTGAVLYAFAYDSAGKLTQITDASGNVTTIARDAAERPVSITSPYGQLTAFNVDGHGYLSQVVDPADNVTKLVASASGLLTGLTDADSNVHSFQYDNLGRLMLDADPAGGSISLARTDTTSGYSVTKTTAMGRTTNYAAAFSSSASSTTEQLTNTWPNGLVATETDTQQSEQLSENTSLPDGTTIATTYGPDPRWGIQVPILNNGSVSVGPLIENIRGSRTATVGTPGNPFSLATQSDTVTVNGRTYTSVFSAAQRAFVNTTPMGRSSTVGLDTLERIHSTQINGLASTVFGYDSRGRLASATQSNRQLSLGYDLNGFLSSVTDRLGHKTSFTHDAAGRVLTETLPDGRVIEYSYDANGNLTAMTPPGGVAHAFTYTPVDLASSYTPPAVAGTGATTYSYDLDRVLTQVTRPDGQTIRFDYDGAGRPNSVVTPTSMITYAYSPTTGTLASVTNTASESISYTYTGPLLTQSALTGTVSGHVSHAYDSNFWVISESVNDGNAIVFSRDDDGLLTRAGALTIANSPANGLLTGTALGQASDALTYNTLGELAGYTATYSNGVLYAMQLKRDVAGQISAKTETIGGLTYNYAYGYDAAGRLTTAIKNGKIAESYTYDANSNRLTATTARGSVSARYDAQDRLLTYGNASYTYTANGELASVTTGKQITHYTYDVLGNLTEVALPSGNSITYVIDPKNRRVGKKVNGALVTGFLYSGSKVVAQLDGSNAIVSQFVYGTGSKSPDYMVRGAATYRIFPDHLGSPRLVVDVSTGQVVQEIDYDAFGNVINDTNPGFQPFGFAGGVYDQDTKLVRFGARDFDPSIGRWTAKDPILFTSGGTNVYTYVSADPVNLTDPLGLAPNCTRNRGWSHQGICTNDPNGHRRLRDVTTPSGNEWFVVENGGTFKNHGYIIPRPLPDFDYQDEIAQSIYEALRDLGWMLIEFYFFETETLLEPPLPGTGFPVCRRPRPRA